MKSFCSAILTLVIAAFTLWLAQATIVPPQSVLASDRLFGRVSSNPEVVRVAGQEAFTIQAPAGGFSPIERTLIVENNINNALLGARDHSPSIVETIMINHLPVIRVDGKHVVTVTTECAKMAGTTMETLAAEWADSIRRALSQTAMVEQYLSELSGNFLNTIYNPPYRRARLEAARLNHAAVNFRADLPANLVSSDSFEDRGMTCILNKDYGSAMLNFQTAISLNPDNPRAHYGLALCLMNKGDVSTAIQELQVSRMLFPNDAEVHLALGQAFESQGNDRQALDQYREAALLQPNNPTPYLVIADMREERNDIGKSVNELWDAYKLVPTSEYIRLKRQDQLSWRLNRAY